MKQWSKRQDVDAEKNHIWKANIVACMKINIIGAIFKHKNNGLFRELSKSAKEFKISMPIAQV